MCDAETGRGVSRPSRGTSGRCLARPTSWPLAGRRPCGSSHSEAQARFRPGTSRAAPTIGSLVIAAASLAACSGGRHATPSTSGPSSSVATRHSNVYTFGVVGTSGKVLQLEHTTPTLVSGITGTVVQIATSNSDSYALTSAGTVFAWGVGSSGQLGDGSTIDFMSVAVKVEISRWRKDYFTCEPHALRRGAGDRLPR